MRGGMSRADEQEQLVTELRAKLERAENKADEQEQLLTRAENKIDEQEQLVTELRTKLERAKNRAENGVQQVRLLAEDLEASIAEYKIEREGVQQQERNSGGMSKQ
ncbi:hypothetical protein P3S68_023709 [Capsicum galapagoense]